MIFPLAAIGAAAATPQGQQLTTNLSGGVSNLFGGGAKKKKNWSPSQASGLAIDYYRQGRRPPAGEPMVLQFWQILVNAYGPAGSPLPARKFPPLGVNPSAPPPNPNTISRQSPNRAQPINPKQRGSAPIRGMGRKGTTAMNPTVPGATPSNQAARTRKGKGVTVEQVGLGLGIAASGLGIARALKWI